MLFLIKGWTDISQVDGGQFVIFCQFYQQSLHLRGVARILFLNITLQNDNKLYIRKLETDLKEHRE